MQEKDVPFDHRLMVDEDVPFNRCPCHQVDTQLEKRKIQGDPSTASALGEHRPVMQEVEGDGQLCTDDQTVDDQKKSIDLGLNMAPFEVEETVRVRGGEKDGAIASTDLHVDRAKDRWDL